MRKKNNKNEELINEELDLSDIKENDLDDTASFTDLMSHKEKKAHKKLKREKSAEEYDEVEDIIDISDEKTIDFKTEEISSQISENKTIDLKDVVKDNKQDNNEENEYIFEENEYTFEENEDMIANENTNITNTVFISMGIIGALVYYIYSILYTNLQNNKNYLLANGIAIVILIFNYCLMTISSKKTAKTLTVLNYLIILAYIAFNLLIYLKII